MNLITFLSDFGLDDSYVGSVKGVILCINPDSKIIDITHNIQPFHIEGAAYTIQSYFDNYPDGTVHLAVVDPGVGSDRFPIIIKTAKYLFVGPDNGIFSYIYEKEEYQAYIIDINKLYQYCQNTKNISSTFHARDIFGPAAALLSKGVAIEKFSTNYTKRLVSIKSPLIVTDDFIKAKIISIDRFGNIITNLSKQKYEQYINQKNIRVEIKNKILAQIQSSYSAIPNGEILAIWGSSGFLEISKNRGNAFEELDSAPGDNYIRIYLINK